MLPLFQNFMKGKIGNWKIILKLIATPLSQMYSKYKPALIVNKKEYNVGNLTNTNTNTNTNTCVNIPWGVEITWALITHKIVSKDSVIKKIVLGATYIKPRSKKKLQLLIALHKYIIH